MEVRLRIIREEGKSKRFLDPNHVLHKSQLVGPLFAFLGIVVSCFVFAKLNSFYQYNLETYKFKQEQLKVFSKSISQTINYYRTMREYLYKRKNLQMTNSNYENIKYFEDKYEAYYDKYASIDPPYESACAIVKSYFDDISIDIDNFKNKLDELFSINYELDDGIDRCVFSINNKYYDFEKKLWIDYEILINKMSMQLKSERNISAWNISWSAH